MTEQFAPPWESVDGIGTPVSPSARHLADVLFEGIVADRFQYGTRLPAERALAETHGVTRATVRQALGLLELHGVIDRKQGSGSTVRHLAGRQSTATGIPALDPGDLSQITSPLEFSVARSVVEPEIIRLAVLNMTSRNIQSMRDILQELEAVNVDGEAFSLADDALRLHIAQSCRNPMLLAIWRVVHHVGSTADWAIRRRRDLTPGRIRDMKGRTRTLCAAIENREIESAIEHTRLALADLHQDLVRGA